MRWSGILPSAPAAKEPSAQNQRRQSKRGSDLPIVEDTGSPQCPLFRSIQRLAFPCPEAGETLVLRPKRGGLGGFPISTFPLPISLLWLEGKRTSAVVILLGRGQFPLFLHQRRMTKRKRKTWQNGPGHGLSSEGLRVPTLHCILSSPLGREREDP